MIILPEDAFIIRVEKTELGKSKGGVYIKPSGLQTVPSIGEVIYAGDKVKEYLGNRVAARESFGDKILLDGEEVVYFRDFYSSIFYIIKE